MRGLTRATVVALILELTLSTAGHAAQGVPPTALSNLPYPDQVSLTHEPAGWIYRQDKTGLPLYFSAADSPGKSVCYGECALQWIPLQAPATEKPLGEWTIVVRGDGLRQWAFKGRPIYTHAGDTPDTPTGAGNRVGWHLLPHFL